jgi:hypothetical protein
MPALIVGQTVEPIRKTVYQRALVEREWAPNSIHNDEWTRKAGYPGALTSAYVINGYVSELALSVFGRSWCSSGTYKLSFVGKGMQRGDEIDVCGVVAAVEPAEEGASAVTLDVWIEKLDGTKAVVGRVTGRLPAPVAA